MKFIQLLNITSIIFLATLLISSFVLFHGCQDDPVQNTTPSEPIKKPKVPNQKTKIEQNDELPNQPKDYKVPEISLSEQQLLDFIGEPGKYKIFYLHGGICVDCQIMIALLEDVSQLQHNDELEFHHFEPVDIDAKDLTIEDFGITDLEIGSIIIFDTQNKPIWQKFYPTFEDVIDGLKIAGFSKEISKPELPPDFFE